MSIQITDCTPRIRCYKCGSTDIEAICHQCQRAMCTLHVNRMVDTHGKSLSVEFTDLGLHHSCDEIPIHCEFCNHVIYPRNWILVILGIFITLLAALPFGTLARITVGLIGIGIIGLAFYINMKRFEKLIRYRPPLPLIPHFNTIQIHEIVRGKINLNSNGDYSTSIPYAAGIFDIKSNFGKPERDQLEYYRKKYHLNENQNIKFNAGFVALRGSSGVDFLDGSFADGGTVLALTGQVRLQPVLINAESHESGEWHKSRKYNLISVITDEPLPIHIVPSLLQKAARRALDLEIQWTEQNSNTNRIRIHKIDRFYLEVPAKWGQIERVAENPAAGQVTDPKTGDMLRTITWRNLPIKDSERREHHRTFSIQFEDAIGLNDSIRGRLELTYKGTLSKIESVDLFFPIGSRRRIEPTVISTKFIIDFELSLADLRYQDIRVVPDSTKDKDKSETLMFEGIIPDHKTVITLTNAISRNFYIKRIIENPPRTGEQANFVNRDWDIAGRHYQGVYPIDFHLTLSGQVIYGGEYQARAGTTKVTLNVQGAYANEIMEAQIVNAWEQLHYLIHTILEKLPKTKPATLLDNNELPSSVLPQDINSTPSADSRNDRINALRKRLDELFEMLTIGRLSEQTFLSLKSETERELQSLLLKVHFN